MSKIKLTYGLILLLFVCSSVSVNSGNETIIKSFYEAYNKKDYSKLNMLISDNIVVKEMGYTVLESKNAFIDLVEWGEVLNSSNKLKKLTVENNKIIVLETQKSDRIDFLYGKPIKAKTEYTIVNQKITQIEVELIDFESGKMMKNKDKFNEWVTKNLSVNLNSIHTLNRVGGEEFKKAMELYKKSN
jgi:ketosteroid isomerase-like protein